MDATTKTYSHFLGDKRRVTISYGWLGRYISPPHGIYYLWAVSMSRSPGWIDELNEIYPQRKVFGYCCNVAIEDDEPKRKVSPEGKASIRKKRLEARVKKRKNKAQLPLFPEFENAEVEKKIAEKPEYFSPESIRQEDIRFEKEMAEYVGDRRDKYVEDLRTVNEVYKHQIHMISNDCGNSYLYYFVDPDNPEYERHRKEVLDAYMMHTRRKMTVRCPCLYDAEPDDEET